MEYKYWLNYFFRIKWSVTLFYVKYASIISGGLFISSPFEVERGLIETGGVFERGGLFNSERTMVSVPHKEVEYGEEKLKYKKF